MASPEVVQQVENPEANSILEKIYQTLGNIIRIFDIQESDLCNDAGSPWDGIIGASIFALRATYHATLHATSCQLVFRRDVMLNVKFEASW